MTIWPHNTSIMHLTAKKLQVQSKYFNGASIASNLLWLKGLINHVILRVSDCSCFGEVTIFYYDILQCSQNCKDCVGYCGPFGLKRLRGHAAIIRFNDLIFT